MLAKESVKNQITLSKAIVAKLPATDYFEVGIRGEEIVLRPVVIEAKGIRLEKIGRKVKALGLSEKDIDAAICWIK
jgi:hypothetical protein